jgi:hypothetical protein
MEEQDESRADANAEGNGWRVLLKGILPMMLEFNMRRTRTRLFEMKF